MRARVRAAAVLVVAALVVASCSDGEVPDTLPEVASTSAATAETLSPTPTGDPTAALEAEITAFFEEYIQTINESWSSNAALQRRREMFSDACEPCLAGYDLAARAHQEELFLDAEPATARRVRLDAVDADIATVLVVEDVPAGRLIDGQGVVIEEFGASLGAQVIYRVQRQPSGDRWMIIASDLLSVEGGGR
jgi:hypothetical protein